MNDPRDTLTIQLQRQGRLRNAAPRMHAALKQVLEDGHYLPKETLAMVKAALKAVEVGDE